MKTTKILGSCPALQSIGGWILAGILTFVFWQIYILDNVFGLIGIGLSQFFNLYLFFRGIYILPRTIPWWKSKKRASQLNLDPDYGYTSTDFMLIDESRGIWVINGKSGNLAELSLLKTRTDDQTLFLDIYTQDFEAPLISLTIKTQQDMLEISNNLLQSVQKCGGVAKIIVTHSPMS